MTTLKGVTKLMHAGQLRGSRGSSKRLNDKGGGNRKRIVEIGIVPVVRATSAQEAMQSLLDFCFQSYRKWGMGPWGMFLKKNRMTVGNCGFCRIDFKHNCGEVNYHVARQYRGQGLASEALKAVLKFGFEDIGLPRIQARCGPDNVSLER